MSKPTERIIELSRELDKLGYEKELDYGDWAVSEDKVGFVVKFYTSHLAFKSIEIQVDENSAHEGTPEDFIPIPSLEDGLEWLSKQEATNRPGVTKCFGSGWICEYDKLKRYTSGGQAIADTPHEAVLMAMVKVLEADDE